MIELKMAKIGLSKRVLVISEAWTSKTCWKCNTKGNRIRQDLFQCINPSCGWKYSADVNGAINIAKKLVATFILTNSRNRAVRGLGKFLPVAPSYKSKKKNGKARNITKNHNGCPKSLVQTNGNAGTQRSSSSLNDFFENDQPVVKNHGNSNFVESGKRRSGRKHGSKRTEPISTKLLLRKINKEKVMVTSDIG
jgi:hypothetical protein